MKTKNLMSVLLITLTMLVFATASSFATVSGENVVDNNFHEKLIESKLLTDRVSAVGPLESSIIPYGSAGIIVSGQFVRSGSKGKAAVNALCTKANKLVSNISLQVYKDGSYVSTGAKAPTVSIKSRFIGHSATFTISSKKNYRIKVTITATLDSGSKLSKTCYITLTK